MFDFFDDDPKAEIIDEIISLELENLFDYSKEREEKIQQLRKQIDYYEPVLPQ